jgi:hypothetical protein
MRRLISMAMAVLSGCSVLSPFASAQQGLAEGWTSVAKIPDEVAAGEAHYRAEKGSAFRLDRAALSAVLAGAPLEGTAAAANPLRVRIPMPDGGFSAFDVVESPNMPAELSARYPEIKSYAGKGVDEPEMTIRFDLSPYHGFSGMILTPGSAIYVYRYTKTNLDYYTAFEKKNFGGRLGAWKCYTVDQMPPIADRDFTPGRAGDEIFTYRLAAAATGEYCQATGGTVASTLAAINSVVNEINAIYIRDFAVRFVLATRNDLIIWTNPATDPYTAPNNPPNTAAENTNAINTRIGSSSYDVGHVMMAGNFGGVSLGLGLVCNENTKARAYSSSDPPTGFAMSTRIMAHELGHQFSSPHSWNNCPPVQQQRGANNAYEPGSGNTIMSYAGLCEAENLATDPDPMFNQGTQQFVHSFTRTGGGAFCGTRTASGNSVPQVDAGPDWTIPKGTPFVLRGQGQDADGTAGLTYCWEQRNLGDPISVLSPDDGRSPIIRVRPPTTSSERMIPALGALQSGIFDLGEILPTTARPLAFRLTVRDNNPTAGGIAVDDMVVNSDGRAGPFFVTAPAAGTRWTGVQTVTWAVNGTDQPPVNCSTVSILLSTDDGVTFPTILAENVANDGSQEVVLPTVTALNARIKIVPSNNIFFAFGPRFEIRPPTAGVQMVSTNVFQVDDRFGNGNNNQLAEPGETTVGIRIGVRNNRGTTATGVIGTLTTTTPGVTIKRNRVSFPDLPFGQNVVNDAPFVIAVGPEVACGTTISLRVALQSTTPRSTANISFTIPVGLPARPGEPQTFTYNTFPVPIPDFPNPSVKIRINVSGVGTIGKVQFKLNGDECSTVIGATGVGLDHQAVGDLLIGLISPDGTPVEIFNQPGAMNTPTEGNNFCQTVFDDDALTSIQDIRDEENPYSGSYRPLNPLATLIGHPADGTWIIDAADQRFGFTGNLRSASVIVSPQLPPLCVPPIRPVCPGDLDDGTGDGVPDGGVTIDDLLYYLNQFALGSALADLDDGTGTGTPDGGVTIDDLIFMVARYEAGC